MIGLLHIVLRKWKHFRCFFQSDNRKACFSLFLKFYIKVCIFFFKCKHIDYIKVHKAEHHILIFQSCRLTELNHKFASIWNVISPCVYFQRRDPIMIAWALNGFVACCGCAFSLPRATASWSKTLIASICFFSSFSPDLFSVLLKFLDQTIIPCV